MKLQIVSRAPHILKNDLQMPLAVKGGEINSPHRALGQI